mmetsp:Transcript_23228/g.57467  ORF Transcript_23228/g.57467 Transcript_23228/m.57467 type:complete len:82 (-) Transcript_23228:303-548(-)
MWRLELTVREKGADESFASLLLTSISDATWWGRQQAGRQSDQGKRGQHREEGVPFLYSSTESVTTQIGYSLTDRQGTMFIR